MQALINPEVAVARNASGNYRPSSITYSRLPSPCPTMPYRSNLKSGSSETFCSIETSQDPTEKHEYSWISFLHVSLQPCNLSIQGLDIVFFAHLYATLEVICIQYEWGIVYVPSTGVESPCPLWTPKRSRPSRLVIHLVHCRYSCP